MELNWQLQPQKLQQAKALLHYFTNLNKLEKEKKITWEFKASEKRRIKKDYHKILGSDCIIIF